MRLSGQAFIFSASTFITNIIGILSAIILSRLLQQEDYGSFKQLWLVFNTITPLVVLGINNSMIFFTPKWGEEYEKSLLFMANSLISILAIIAGLILYFCADPVAQFLNNPKLIPFLKVFAFYPLFYLSISFKNIFLLARGKIFLSSISTLISSILLIVCSTLPVILYNDLLITIKWIVYGAAIQYFFYIILYFIYYSNNQLLPTYKQLQDFIVYSLSLGLTSLVATYSDYIDKYFVSYYFNPDQFAIYSNGTIQLPITSIILTSSMMVLFPKMVSLHKENDIPSMLNIWNEACRKISLIVFPTFIFCFIMAEPIVTLMFSNRYIGSVIIFKIYILIFAMRFTQFSTFMLIFSDLKWHLILSFSYLFLNIILNFFSIKLIGLEGPAYASVLVAAIVTSAILYRSKLLLKTSIWNILPYKNLIVNMLISILAGAGTFYASRLLGLVLSKLLYLVISGFLYLFIFITLAKLTNAINKNDLLIFKK